MTTDETLAIMSVLRAAYPGYYRDVDKDYAASIAELWATMFAEEPAELVAAAVKAHIASDSKGFPPHIGAIKNAIIRLRQPRELTEIEAWALVERAVNGASMSPQSVLYRGGETDGRTSAERNFDRLPPLLRRVVGSPQQLAAWAAMKEETVGTVVASNFQRNYRAVTAKEREYLALPSDVRALTESTAETVSGPPDGKAELEGLKAYLARLTGGEAV